MQWNVAAPFFSPETVARARWLDDFVPGGQHSFRKIPFTRASSESWHQRVSRGTPLGGWNAYWKTARRSLDSADGVITLFPQLGTMVGLQQRLRGRRKPVVAWCFNLGYFPTDLRRSLARFALGKVDRFVVHSTGEIDLIANYLDIPRSRVRFVPLQRAPIGVEDAEEDAQPFVLAMGSANRDYKTLVEAAKITSLPLTIVAAPRCVADISLPPNVKFLTALTPHQCHVLVRQARFSIVPLADTAAASGQVTVIEAQRLARAVIATRSMGTIDYIDDGRTGLLVDPRNPEDLAGAMRKLWEDRTAREAIAAGGAAFASSRLSDEAAGGSLGHILDELAAQYR
jgi:glycosyltransferase involved in cell wall biosynthesis